MIILAYGTGVDLHDEYIRMSAQTIRKSVEKFVQGVVSNLGEEYLRRPIEDDLAYLLTLCSRNDINVLEQSPVFKYILEGRAPKATFVKSVNGPQTRKHQLFAQHQEAARKDVERSFGVLQARFNFIKRPCLMWDRDMMGKVMLACITMHNMIVEDERHTCLNYCDPKEFMEVRMFNSQSGDVEANDDPNFKFSTERIASLASNMRNKVQLRNMEAHNALKNDLIEHIWQKFGPEN
ncbi:uncharacterized protein LOC131023378 [Salvia miltiorrhiza]|uniref:uncharacterized protein LOC131023378 n=1 Tax=Salvia miltiorrhiza TaxID=226208 RepID=UPI0025ACCA44|nr:uncharacterized protein LOC131023378 [Salvia miltiorrhiza]